MGKDYLKNATMKHVLFMPKNMWKSARQLVEKPESFGSFGEARVFSVDVNPLWVAKEVVAIILTVGPASYARHGPGLRHFLLNKDSTFLPSFKLFFSPGAWLTGSRYHFEMPHKDRYLCTGIQACRHRNFLISFWFHSRQHNRQRLWSEYTGRYQNLVCRKERE